MTCKECGEDFNMAAWGRSQKRSKLCNACYFQELWRIDGVAPDSAPVNIFIKLCQEQRQYNGETN